MKEEFCRTALLLGKDGVERLSQAKVAVFGVGGVGSYCVEALARAGIGTLILFDSDRIAVSNINRQLIALHSTVGMLKTEVAARRIADINPDCHVIQYPVFFLPENAAPIRPIRLLLYRGCRRYRCRQAEYHPAGYGKGYPGYQLYGSRQ